MNDNAKFVARIANNSPIAFESVMESVNDDSPVDEDVQDLDENNPWSGASIKAEPPAEVETGEKEPPAEIELKDNLPVVPPEEEPEPDKDLAEYSSAALVAMQLKDKRPDIFDDVDQNLDWENLIEKIDSYIGDTVNAASSYKLEEIDKVKDYVQFILDGGSAEALQEAMKHTDLTKIDVAEADEEDLEQIIRAVLTDKNIPSDDIDTVVQTAKMSRNLRTKASQMQQELIKREQLVMQRDLEIRRQREEQARQQREQITRDIKNEIQKKNIMGFSIDDNTAKRLEESIFKPTVVVEDVVDGQKVTRRITRFEKLKREFDQDLSKQIAFLYLLENNFDLSSFVNTSSKKKNESLMRELEKRSGGGRSYNPRNGYLT